MYYTQNSYPSTPLSLFKLLHKRFPDSFVLSFQWIEEKVGSSLAFSYIVKLKLC